MRGPRFAPAAAGSPSPDERQRRPRPTQHEDPPARAQRSDLLKAHTALVSGGFTHFTGPVAERVGSFRDGAFFSASAQGRDLAPRVAARGGDRVKFAAGFLTLAPDEAWLLSDADEKAAPS